MYEKVKVNPIKSDTNSFTLPLPRFIYVLNI